MKLSARRAEILALIALLMQLLFFLLTLLVSYYVHSSAVRVEAWHFLGGVGIWLILLLQFHQRRLAQEERLDVEQYQLLRREGKDTSVFEGKVIEDTLHLSVRRLAWLEKYLLAIFAVLIAGYLLVMSYLLYGQIRAGEAVGFAARNLRLESAALLAGFALVSFLFSRYAVGMSQQSEWRPLRAGGSFLLSNTLASFALAIILVLSDDAYLKADLVMAYVLVGIMTAIGLETVFNLVLDAFRPRLKGQYRRAAFESRLLGLFSEPGGILRTAAHALDYQFGFKVSETWFFQLLSKAVVPLLLLQALALYLLTCIAIVPPGEVGVLERCGRPTNVNEPYQSGLHLKLPWPLDNMKSFPVEQLQVIEVGFERNDPKYDEQGREIPELTPIIWTKEHWKKEHPFMVAVKKSDWLPSSDRKPIESKNQVLEDANAPEDVNLKTPGDTGDEVQRTDFDMLVVSLVINYRIRNVAEFAYGDTYCYLDPHKFLEAICHREAVLYAAHSDIERLLGPGRKRTAEDLKNLIQAQMDQYRMGMEIVFVGLESVHPPVAVAESYEQVISAQQTRQASILKAQGQAQELLAQVRGESAVLEAQAQAYAFERSEMARADSARFARQLQALEKGKTVYLWREYLSVLEELLPKMRKYVMATHKVNSWVYELDLKEKLEPDLFKELGIEREKQEK